MPSPSASPPSRPCWRRSVAEAGLCIAIDGPAASGKGTVARLVARRLGYRYLDTGAMYRATALAAREQGVSWSDADGVAAVARQLRFDFRWSGTGLDVLVDGRDRTRQLRAQDVGEGASAVAVHPPVRAALVALQQAMAQDGGVVMDGRDIGTVVMPDAPLKVFLTASAEERARRRWRELSDRGTRVPFGQIVAELEARDHQDSHRKAGPLRQAGDAVVVDTTGLSAEQAAARVIGIALERGARLPDHP
ncbi:MAG: (d)CMP kinase [Alphaproteobacteria bacterium]|nr:(d)CMP kinase [Alphaproteobacteria bacterium]